MTLGKGVEVADWYVDESFNNSDHNTISFEILVGSDPPKLIRPWKRANWTIFRRILSKHNFFVPAIMSIKKVDRLVQSLYKILNHALNKSCPLRPTRPEKSNLKWWNKKLKREGKIVDKQFKVAKRCKTLTETVKLKLMKQNFKKMCKREKTNSWRKFTYNLKDND